MIAELARWLAAWEQDPGLAAVLLTGAGERGFCAGGDLVLVRDAIRADRPELARALWRAEYELDGAIARFPKPIVSVLDGVVMGGGVGLACHASHRLATERAVVAMPEVGVGLHPDAGVAFLLARMPGEVGTHLALTGRRIGPKDAVYCGFADRTVALHAVDGLRERLAEGRLDEVLGQLPEAPWRGEAPGQIERGRIWIDAAYRGDSVARILTRLRARPEPEARRAAAEIETRSPTSLKVTLRALRRAGRMTSLEACLEQDLRLSCAFLAEHDLAEGIRAVLVDKDREPRWSPASLAEVTTDLVDRFFAAGGDELTIQSIRT